MVKSKFLHNDINKSSRIYKKFRREYMLDFYSDLPNYESIRRRSFKIKEYNYYRCDFSILDKFIFSKINCDWNDIYSEILKKVNKKYRYTLDIYLSQIIHHVVFDSDYIPRTCYGGISQFVLYVDFNNKICYDSKKEIINKSIKHLRKIKLQEIFSKKESQSLD